RPGPDAGPGAGGGGAPDGGAIGDEPGDGSYDLAVVDGGDWTFWEYANLNSVMTTAPGVWTWTSTVIAGDTINAETLADFDVLVVADDARGYVTHQMQDDVHAWVRAGGVLIIAPVHGDAGTEPLLSCFGADFRVDWSGGEWCDAPLLIDPAHPLVSAPNPLLDPAQFDPCWHVSADPATLGGAWRVAVATDTGAVVLASAGAGRGGVSIAGTHWAHNLVAQRHLAENLITHRFEPGAEVLE
ncbi:hypothetical protein, partial [Haliangium sp.]|uniref:hypothetical protein n=1 Tax=Haliangium sp. TaxID=2663208 RepID=UPI003D0DF1C6